MECGRTRLSKQRACRRAVHDDGDPRAGPRSAGRFDATAVDGFRALTAREDIDAVLLLADQWYGALPILAACQLGKAIYCATNAQIMPAQASEL